MRKGIDSCERHHSGRILGRARDPSEPRSDLRRMALRGSPSSFAQVCSVPAWAAGRNWYWMTATMLRAAIAEYANVNAHIPGPKWSRLRAKSRVRPVGWCLTTHTPQAIPPVAAAPYICHDDLVTRPSSNLRHHVEPRLSERDLDLLLFRRLHHEGGKGDGTCASVFRFSSWPVP